MPPKKSARPKAKPRPPKRPARAAVRLSPAAKTIVGILDDQKAVDIRVVPLDNHVADAFILATASGVRHLHSLTEHLLEKMETAGFAAHHVEGYGASHPSERWVLVDFTDVVVHLFTEDGRKFYNLDRLIEER